MAQVHESPCTPSPGHRASKEKSILLPKSSTEIHLAIILKPHAVHPCEMVVTVVLATMGENNDQESYQVYSVLLLPKNEA